MSKPKIPYTWYGGKVNFIDDICPLIPDTRVYVEPFGGSGAILLNKREHPIEVFNDIDSNIVNFLRVLRRNRDELIRRLKLVPWSREEHEKSKELLKAEDFGSSMDQAVYFFITIEQGYNSVYESGWRRSLFEVRNGLPMVVSRWEHRVGFLDAVADRLTEVLIEHKDAFAVIEDFDSTETVFYIDPPYPESSLHRNTQGYQYAFSDDDFRHLHSTLTECDGDVLLSTYEADIIDELFGDWFSKAFDERTLQASNAGRTTQEMVYANYNFDAIRRENSIMEW